MHIPKSGYVGIGTVKREAQPYDEAEFLIDGELRKMTLWQSNSRPQMKQAMSLVKAG